MKRISHWLGALPETSTPATDTNTNPLEEARKAGIPLMEGKLPNDPNLAFLDQDIPLGMGLNRGG